jgi:hypothetical protein
MNDGDVWLNDTTIVEMFLKNMVTKTFHPWSLTMIL